MHCVICIEPTGEQVKMRQNLAHWVFWDTTAFVKPIKQRVNMLSHRKSYDAQTCFETVHIKCL